MIGGIAMPFCPADAYYEYGPAGWVRRQAEQRGLVVKVDPDLETPGHGIPGGVVARPGLPFPTFHWIVACGVVVQLFGPDAAPDLPIVDVAQTLHNAQVLPFQRPGMSTGRWRA